MRNLHMIGVMGYIANLSDVRKAQIVLRRQRGIRVRLSVSAVKRIVSLQEYDTYYYQWYTVHENYLHPAQLKMAKDFTPDMVESVIVSQRR